MDLLCWFLETVAGELLNTRSRPLFSNIILQRIQTEYALYLTFIEMYICVTKPFYPCSWCCCCEEIASYMVIVTLMARTVFLCWHVMYSIYCIFIAHLLTSIQVVHCLESFKTDWPKKGNHVLKHRLSDN